MIHIILYILLAILIADFLTGIFHWWEDRYGNPDWPILGKLVVIPNINHHKHPSNFTNGSYWKRNYTAIIPSLSIGLVFLYFKQYFWFLVFLIASQSNEIHCWEHMKTNRLVKILQKYYILQNKKTHAIHHKRPYSTNYCVMTMMVNPILSSIYFWKILENFIYYTTGIRPRKERELF